MSASFYDLQKFAATGIASPEMTHYDKMLALAMAGGGKIETLTGVPPLSFRANGKPLISLSMLGNTQQTGTPSPDNIIMPDFCGKLVGTDWTIPITCGGQTTPVYLGQTQTVRRVKKMVLTGEESPTKTGLTATDGYQFRSTITDYNSRTHFICSHMPVTNASDTTETHGYSGIGLTLCFDKAIGLNTEDKVQSYLAAQYAAGTPVTVWYVLAAPETGIVNEPLCKIGDYADELHIGSEVTIPTIKGSNTLSIDTELPPSSVSITGHIKQ